jgi:chromate transporter
MAVVTLQLGRAALIDAATLLLALASALLLIAYKPNATWLVLGGAAAGWLLHRAGLAR